MCETDNEVVLDIEHDELIERPLDVCHVRWTEILMRVPHVVIQVPLREFADVASHLKRQTRGSWRWSMGHRLHSITLKINESFVSVDENWDFYYVRGCLLVRLVDALERQDADTEGRPNFSFARTIFVQSWLNDVITHYRDGGADSVVGHLSIFNAAEFDMGIFEGWVERIQWMRNFYDEMTCTIRFFLNTHGIRMGLWAHHALQDVRYMAD